MKQYFIIGGNGKEYGPVSKSEVFEWIKEGRANGDTQIKETEAEEWSLIRNLEQFNFSTLPSNNPEDIPATGRALQKLRNKIHLTNPITIRPHQITKPEISTSGVLGLHKSRFRSI